MTTTNQRAVAVLEELLSRFEATIPTPSNRRGESTMRIEHFIGLAHEAKQAIATLRAPGWRPISEAPRDGTVFMTFMPSDDPEYQFDFAYWIKEEECWGKWGCGFEFVTHWQPLPPPPGEG